MTSSKKRRTSCGKMLWFDVFAVFLSSGLCFIHRLMLHHCCSSNTGFSWGPLSWSQRVLFTQIQHQSVCSCDVYVSAVADGGSLSIYWCHQFLLVWCFVTCCFLFYHTGQGRWLLGHCLSRKTATKAHVALPAALNRSVKSPVSVTWKKISTHHSDTPCSNIL